MSMFTIERRPTTLSALRALGDTNTPVYQYRNLALPSSIRNAMLSAQLTAPPAAAVDPYAHQPVDYLPLAVAGVASFALGAAGIVLLLKRRGGK